MAYYLTEERKMASGARPRAARVKGRLSEVSRLSVRAQSRAPQGAPRVEPHFREAENFTM